QALEHYEIAAASLTDDAWLLARVGDLQRSFGRYEDSARSFELLAEMRRGGWADLSSRPSAADGSRGWSPTGPDRDAWVVLGEVRAEGGDAAGALAAWRRVIDRDRSDPANWLEVASACWDYFLFDEALDVFDEERRTLGDPNLHAKQLAAVHESKRDYPRAITEYVTILGQGDPMVREDVRIRLVYVARHKGLDKAIRTTFERAIKADPDHEGLYRNYADFTARLEDWPAVYSIYGAADATVSARLQGSKNPVEFSLGEAHQTGKSTRGRVTLERLGGAKQWMEVEIIDSSTGQPTPVRLHMSGARGEYLAPYGHHEQVNAHWFEDYGADLKVGGRQYAYVPGVFTTDLPSGPLYVEMTKGFEYAPTRVKVDIKPG
ncbi:MAG: tetratricopeptide repeat protein, partial [Myxococcota bacterium]|nr:tetratricopeptide repeat protein [Myxococcota bacterium]